MKLNGKSLFVSVLAAACIVTTPVRADIRESNCRQKHGMTLTDPTARLVVHSSNERLQLAWCNQMGGYPSFEAQARAQAAQRESARRKADAEARRAQSAQVMKDQQSLKDLGYYRGTVDARVGPVTTGAIRQFRSANNLGAGTTLDANCRQLIASGKAVRKESFEVKGKASTLRDDQKALADLGFYKGKVDGIPGRMTSSAIRQFKIKYGLDASTDTLDAASRAKLMQLQAAQPTRQP
jgi:peptidoglycan hydrolase-like protein with peptidoglycan-binding domain